MTSRRKIAAHRLSAARFRQPDDGTGQASWEKGVVADTRIEAGALIIRVDGVVYDAPSQYSLQVGPHEHLCVPAEISPETIRESYPWLFLNHSCRPNAAFEGRDLIALEAIEAGQQIVFDYNTTELDMDEPFVCRCGHCEGVSVRGFAHLSADEQRRREPLLAAHLRRQLAIRNAG